MNKAILIGRLGADPEKRFTPTGKVVVRFTLATDRRYTDANGEKVEHTDWHNVEVWGKMAETVAQYCSKGKLVCVEGRLQTDRYESNGETKYWNKIVASQVEFLSRNPGENGASSTIVEGDMDCPF